MSPTESEPTKELTPTILEWMSEIFIEDYERKFKPAYEEAARLRKKRKPIEPSEEMRNAFDHFALAVRNALLVDGHIEPTPKDLEKPTNPAIPKKLEDRAVNNLEQAKRHISVGRFYCVAHQIEAISDDIEVQILKLTDQT